MLRCSAMVQLAAILSVVVFVTLVAGNDLDNGKVVFFYANLNDTACNKFYDAKIGSANWVDQSGGDPTMTTEGPLRFARFSASQDIRTGLSFGNGLQITAQPPFVMSMTAVRLIVRFLSTSPLDSYLMPFTGHPDQQDGLKVIHTKDGFMLSMNGQLDSAHLFPADKWLNITFGYVQLASGNYQATAFYTLLGSTAEAILVRVDPSVSIQDRDRKALFISSKLDMDIAEIVIFDKFSQADGCPPCSAMNGVCHLSYNSEPYRKAFCECSRATGEFCEVPTFGGVAVSANCAREQNAFFNSEDYEGEHVKTEDDTHTPGFKTTTYVMQDDKYPSECGNARGHMALLNTRGMHTATVNQPLCVTNACNNDYDKCLMLNAYFNHIEWPQSADFDGLPINNCGSKSSPSKAKTIAIAVAVAVGVLLIAGLSLYLYCRCCRGKAGSGAAGSEKTYSPYVDAT